MADVDSAPMAYIEPRANHGGGRDVEVAPHTDVPKQDAVVGVRETSQWSALAAKSGEFSKIEREAETGSSNELPHEVSPGCVTAVPIEIGADVAARCSIKEHHGRNLHGIHQQATGGNNVVLNNLARRSSAFGRRAAMPPLPLATALRRRNRMPLPFPLEERGCVTFALGRHALWNGVRHLGLGGGDEILTPAYHHGSEVEALTRAGLRCVFYDSTDTLAPDPDRLDALRTPATRALLLVHYLGFPQDAARWRMWCDERQLVLVEDAAQAWLATIGGRPVGSWGDLSIFCLYKTYGLPDGAAGFAPGWRPPQRRERSLGIRPLLRKRIECLLPGSAEPYDRGKDFALGNPSAGPTAATTALLRRVVDPRTAARRRANYTTLLCRLEHLVPLAFRALPDGASPFAFPIETDEKARLLSALAGRGIHALDFWSQPHPSVRPAEFPDATGRRDRIVGLPTHQELRPADLEAIAEATEDGTR